VADAVTVDTWTGRGVRLSEVVQALADLRHRQAHPTAARTAVMTLVAVVPDDDSIEPATSALRSLAGHHPARLLLLRPDPDRVASLDAGATLHSVNGDGIEVNVEEVRLDIGGQAAHHLDSLVEPFTLADLPVAVWYVSAVPDPTDPLLGVASSVLLDSRDAADTGRMRSLLELARRRTVVDLSWIRLGPWRQLLAGLFDPPTARPWARAVERVEVRGKIGPRQLLGGWLASQLGLLPRQVELLDSRHVEITIAARQGDATAVFAVRRADAHRTVSAQAVIDGTPGPEHWYPLADDPLTTALANALTHLEPDVVWENTLSAAMTLSPADSRRIG
jgi:glucose-6-phosphate dehydrogenase assembly protein OpcA